MLPATQQEIEHVTEYMKSQAPDLTVLLALHLRPRSSMISRTNW
jgi:hypothetical protein